VLWAKSEFSDTLAEVTLVPFPSTAMTPPLTLSPLLSPPSSVDLPRSRDLAARVHASDRDCFRNALSALPFTPGAMYVEGLAVSHSLLVRPEEHGWLQLPDGTILDPTPVYCHEGTSVHTYFPMFNWTRDDLRHAFGTKPSVELPLRSAMPFADREYVEFRDATLMAWRHLAALHEHEFGEPLYEGDEREFLTTLLGRCWMGPVGRRGAIHTPRRWRPGN
jgi:hypothetical protein